MSPLTSKASSSSLLPPRPQWVLRVQLRFRSYTRRSHHLAILIYFRSVFLLGHIRIMVLLSAYNIRLLFMFAIVILRDAIRKFRIVYLSISRHLVLNTLRDRKVLLSSGRLARSCETTPQSIDTLVTRSLSW